VTTTVVPPLRLRTLDETREPVPLPGPTSPAWADPSTVWRIATYRERTVSPEAHALAHPRPVHDCPFCPPAEGVAPDRSNETYWREVAA
jgi:hypothetical protein